MSPVDGSPRPAPVVAVSRPRRWLLRAAGLALVALAAVGVVVPGLPTTPLLLVAAACFARSSPRLYTWLLHNRVFGPLIHDWRETRTVRTGIKLTAIAMIVLVGGSSLAFFIAHPWAKLAMGITLLALIVWIARLPSPRRVTAPARS